MQRKNFSVFIKNIKQNIYTKYDNFKPSQGHGPLRADGHWTSSSSYRITQLKTARSCSMDENHENQKK